MVNCIECGREAESLCGIGSPMDGINGCESGWEYSHTINVNLSISGQRQGITQYTCPYCKK